VFRKIFENLNSGESSARDSTSTTVSGSVSRKNHPVFGCLRGTVMIAEGVDLTEPVDPNWAEQAENPVLFND